MGFSGALIIIDLDLAYVMNQMRVGIVGCTRRFSFAPSAVAAAMA